MERVEDEEFVHLTRSVIGCAMEVLNHLGPGFLENVYEQALVCELESRGIPAIQQARLTVHYKGQHVGAYVADLLIEDRLIVELKCVEALRDEHIAQCLNYLAASGHRLSLLLNFKRPRLEWRRVIR